MELRKVQVRMLGVLACVPLLACGVADRHDAVAAASAASAGSPATGYSTAGVLCSLTQSVFNGTPSVKATSTATWSCDSGKRVLSANGLPEHATGVFPNANNPNAIASQRVRVSLPLEPVVSPAARARGGRLGDTGYALNGVKFDAGTAGACDSSGRACRMVGRPGEWSIEALGQSAFNFGTDSSHAHVQRNGAYHYHGVPEGLVQSLAGGAEKHAAMTLIGWAADGFPIYARYGYKVAGDAASGVRAMTSSYRLRQTPGDGRPPVGMYAMGTFSQDYEYLRGSGDLDECNGRTGATPEFPSGIYHYYATDTYPYVQRCVKGVL